MSDLISAWVDQDEMRRLAESLLSRPSGSDLNRLEIDFGSQFEGFANEPPASLSASPPAQDVPAAVPEIQEPVAPPQQPVQPEAAISTQFQSEKPPAGPAPSVVRSAVQFLKKAQAEGKAGGVIRGVKPPRYAEPPAEIIPKPTQPEAKALSSPFRRVSDVEGEMVAATNPETITAGAEIFTARRLKRPAPPSGDDPILARVTQFGKWLKGPVGVRNFFVSNTEGKVLIDEVANPKLIQVARSLASASGSASEGEVGSLHVRIGEDSILEVVPTPSQFGILILGLIVEQPLPEELIREIRLGLEEVANARLIKRPN